MKRLAAPDETPSNQEASFAVAASLGFAAYLREAGNNATSKRQSRHEFAAVETALAAARGCRRYGHDDLAGGALR